MPNANKMYPRKGDINSIYLKNAITDPAIKVGDFTVYNDFVNDPRNFEKNNVLYHYPINHDRLIIGKYGSIACGAKFIMTAPITRWTRYPPLFSLSFPMIGTCHFKFRIAGKTKATPLSEVMYGSAMRPSFFPASISDMAPS